MSYVSQLTIKAVLVDYLCIFIRLMTETADSLFVFVGMGLYLNCLGSFN